MQPKQKAARLISDVRQEEIDEQDISRHERRHRRRKFNHAAGPQIEPGRSPGACRSAGAKRRHGAAA